jgi:hypothetical protein
MVHCRPLAPDTSTGVAVVGQGYNTFINAAQNGVITYDVNTQTEEGILFSSQINYIIQLKLTIYEKSRPLFMCVTPNKMHIRP